MLKSFLILGVLLTLLLPVQSWAMTDLYVNTASTAGTQDCTTITAGNSGTAACATLLQALNLLPATLTDAYTIHCSGTAADTSNVDQGPWDAITSATNYLLVEGDNTTGVLSTSHYRLTATNRNVAYNNSPPHVRFNRMQVILTVNDGNSYVGMKVTNANQVSVTVDGRISNSIVKCIITSGSAIGIETRPPTGSGTSSIWNNLVYDCTQGFHSDYPGAVFYNNTAAGNDFGYVEDDTDAIKCVNCLATNAGGIGFVGTFAASSSNNAEDDGNGAPGSSSHSATTFTFVNAGADDYHLAAGDAGAQNLGATNPGAGLFTDDIDGQARGGSLWSIGMDEIVAAGAACRGGLLLLGVGGC